MPNIFGGQCSVTPFWKVTLSFQAFSFMAFSLLIKMLCSLESCALGTFINCSLSMYNIPDTVLGSRNIRNKGQKIPYLHGISILVQKGPRVGWVSSRGHSGYKEKSMSQVHRIIWDTCLQFIFLGLFLALIAFNGAQKHTFLTTSLKWSHFDEYQSSRPPPIKNSPKEWQNLSWTLTILNSRANLLRILMPKDLKHFVNVIHNDWHQLNLIYLI